MGYRFIRKTALWIALLLAVALIGGSLCLPWSGHHAAKVYAEGEDQQGEGQEGEDPQPDPQPEPTPQPSPKPKVKAGRRKVGKNWYYYDSNGAVKKGTFTAGKVVYYTNKKSGAIYGMRLLAPRICQRPQLPTGCEIVSWTMMAQYAGVKISKMRAAAIMPRSGNPNKGFVGSPRSNRGAAVVYPGGLKKMTKKYLGSAVNMTGCSLGKVQNKIFNGHVVLVWVRHLDGFGSHTIAVTGYDKKKIYYNDPWNGKARSMSKKRFKKLWNQHSRRALSW